MSRASLTALRIKTAVRALAVGLRQSDLQLGPLGAAHPSADQARQCAAEPSSGGWPHGHCVDWEDQVVVNAQNPRCLMSAIGTKRTSRGVQPMSGHLHAKWSMSAFGGKADTPQYPLYPARQRSGGVPGMAACAKTRHQEVDVGVGSSVAIPEVRSAERCSGRTTTGRPRWATT